MEDAMIIAHHEHRDRDLGRRWFWLRRHVETMKDRSTGISLVTQNSLVWLCKAETLSSDDELSQTGALMSP
ncbi:hypothetical protein RRG08_014636 [Elysia crispata]|uniref:Uncharacterized protein n=1 Tax=Elysia crispata TaxID=231223 RepID=A0AAE0YRS9_9GAST|nr:hypothetical protein RRG08_014636 [Elysia crispata]